MLWNTPYIARKSAALIEKEFEMKNILNTILFVLSDVKSEHLEIIVDEESHSMMVRSYYGRSTLIAKESEWFDCTPEAMKFIAEKARNTHWNIKNPMKVETKLYFNIAMAV